MKVLITLCFVGVVFCAPQLHREQFRDINLDPQFEEEFQSPPVPYNFGLQVSDDETTNYQTRQESQDENGNVQGEYSWVGSDGFRYITTYSATPKGGFQANTVKEPTDIVVIIPKPRPEFQQQIHRSQNVQNIKPLSQDFTQPEFKQAQHFRQPSRF